MKTLYSTIFLLSLTYTAYSQNQEGWNWPEDENQRTIALEKQAYYKVNMGLEEWGKAFSSLNWLYENNPDLNPSIYMDGVKVAENLLEADPDQEREGELEDSLLWMYDMRMKYFEEDAASAMDRKAYSAFKLYYKTPSKFALLKDLFEKAVQMNGPLLSTFNITPYMTLGKYYYQLRPEEISAEEVLDIHDQLSTILDQKLISGEETEAKIKKEQDKIDALLSSIEGLLTCEFIENKLVPKFNDNPQDLNLAKKIFSYSLKAKCSDKAYFTKAGDRLYQDDPNYKLANALANKYLTSGETEMALKYFNEALNMAENEEEKYDANYGIANTYSKAGNKVKAREFAFKAAEINPSENNPYNLIGNLYFTSFNDCAGGESKVKDRAVFIAAYQAYQNAGNTSQMQAAKEQFPSIEEIFKEGYERGDKIEVKCWINKTVTLETRD